ncbi:MAG: hypothetical protein JWL96_898 [Sphingomonas bacterium]|uniref:hypothetical protein n=1 Tax=Sphingomonas bacterium TaxID=1895847 RepID=UPI00261BDF82|nr:hypothetical protein [Sphingomonas bacterium]MDB5708828.1 hypothetical protein [Sphingomonas bacterium]
MSAEASGAANSQFAKWTIRLLAVVGILGCLAVITIAVILSTVSFGHHEPATVQAAATKQVFTIGNIGKVPHTNLITIEVRATEAGGDAYADGSLRGRNDDLRNILMLDTGSGQSRRLLPDNGRRIDDFRLLPNDANHDDLDDVIGTMGPGKPGKMPSCCYYLLLDRPDASGLKDVMLGVIATGKQAMVLQGVEGVDSISMPDIGHVAVIVRQQRKLSYRIIDLADFKVTANHPIAID